MKHVILALSVLAVTAFADSPRGRPLNDKVDNLNGEWVHRATLTPDNSTAEDNLTASGGTAVAYTFLGGETICIQVEGTDDAYVEVIAAASMTASGAKGVRVVSRQACLANRMTLRVGSVKVAALCTAAGPCTVKIFELR